MRYSLRALLALKRWVIAVALCIWVVGLSLSFVLEGSERAFPGSEPRWIAVSVMALSSVFATLIMVSPRARSRLIEETKADLYDPAPFFLVATLTATFVFIQLFG